MATIARPSKQTGAVASTASCCPLCGSDDSKLIVGAKQRTVVECRGCRLRLLHPPMLLLGKVPLFEPWAHLYAVARRPANANGPPAYPRVTDVPETP